MMIISSGERPKKGQFIEFAIYTDDKHEEICGGDLNHMNGSQWREVNKLVAECEAGLHPNVSLIERVINYTEGDWDVVDKEEEELSAKKGDKVVAYDDEPPVDTILGIEIFPVVHMKTQEKIYVSLEDLSDDS